MSKLFDFCMLAVPGPLKRRPKLAIALAVIGAIGTLGSGLVGFTDVLDYFDEDSTSEEQAYITHQQFNMLIVPMISEMEQMRASIDRLETKVNQNSNTQLKSLHPSHNKDINTLAHTLDQVKELQTKQRNHQ